MERKIILGGLLKRVIDYNIDTFEGRLTLQKTVYLLQAFGLHLGYNFSWYLYGPYSPDLTKDAYEIKDIYKDIPKMKFVNEEKERRFREFIRFIHNFEDNLPYWLEILSSIHFLQKIMRYKSKYGIIDMVVKKQPYIKKEDCEKCWDILEKKGLLY